MELTCSNAFWFSLSFRVKIVVINHRDGYANFQKTCFSFTETDRQLHFENISNRIIHETSTKTHAKNSIISYLFSIQKWEKVTKPGSSLPIKIKCFQYTSLKVDFIITTIYYRLPWSFFAFTSVPLTMHHRQIQTCHSVFNTSLQNHSFESPRRKDNFPISYPSNLSKTLNTEFNCRKICRINIIWCFYLGLLVLKCAKPSEKPERSRALDDWKKKLEKRG